MCATYIHIFEFGDVTNGYEYGSGVVATTDIAEACKDVNIAIMVGGYRRKEGMERKDLLSKNVFIYKAQASVLEQHASPDCKVFE